MSHPVGMRARQGVGVVAMSHPVGTRAQHAVETARERIGTLIERWSWRGATTIFPGSRAPRRSTGIET